MRLPDPALLVITEPSEAIEKSVRNLPGFKVLRSEGLNVYVAGSSALWSLNFQGANTTQGISKPSNENESTS